MNCLSAKRKVELVMSTRFSMGSGVLGAALVLSFVGATPAGAFPQTLDDWQDRYGALSPSGDNARCQLCHANDNGGSPWNGYGWDIALSLADPSCDLDMSGVVSDEEAFFCIELLNSDGDGSNNDNVTEIGLGTQPGWTEGPFNTLFNTVGGETPNQLPPDDIGPIDPLPEPSTLMLNVAGAAALGAMARSKRAR